ncbi:MAG: hypothetical protein IT372_11995 [Polyangiaceae bacterium]|nr:hypothetical protein [Polyangiaceae bacterium]
MQNFREAMIGALKAPPTPEVLSPWREVLFDLVAGINEGEPGVFAFLRKGGAPGVEHVELAPRGQRDRGEIFLSVYIGPTGLAVLSGEQREFVTIEDFQAYLITLAGKPALRETLEELTRIASEPVTGFLRFGHVYSRDFRRDIVVKLSASAQRELADASESQERPTVVIHVDPTGPVPIGQGVYRIRNPPRWLAAGGYGMQIEAQELEAGRIKLRGKPLSPEDLV